VSDVDKCLMLRYVILANAMIVQCNVYTNRLILCEVYVKLLKSLILLFQKVSVSRTQTKPLTTKINEMCNKI